MHDKFLQPFNIMQINMKVFVAAVSTLFCARHYGADPKLYLVDEMPADPKIQFYITSDAVHRPTNHSVPDAELLSVDITELSRIASRHLIATKNPPNPIKLVGVSFSQSLLFAQQTAALNQSKPRLGLIKFTFGYEHASGILVKPLDYKVVMLRDGTVAEQVKREDSKR